MEEEKLKLPQIPPINNLNPPPPLWGGGVEIGEDTDKCELKEKEEEG